jgi:hypothetical protein
LTAQGQYRVSVDFNLGAAYTLSHLWGNVDGETVNSGPTASDILQYPEYKQASWNTPEGDLSADERHRARFWGTYGIPRVTGLSLGVLHIVESGVPYGAVGYVNSPLVVANPGYLTAPPATSITYYYTARDAFRTAGQQRTDAALNYSHHVGASRVELFGQWQVLNVFNHYQLCGCGAATVFQNGGAVTAARLDQTVTFLPNSFNPFTTTPQQGSIEFRPGVRHRREPHGLHHAADDARVVRCPLLTDFGDAVWAGGPVLSFCVILPSWFPKNSCADFQQPR